MKSIKLLFLLLWSTIACDVGNVAEISIPDELDIENITTCVFESHPELTYKPDHLIDALYKEVLENYTFEGMLIVRFIVDESGDIQNPEIVRGLTDTIDSRVLEIVEQFQFKPAIQTGVPVKVTYSYPFVIRFEN